MYAPNNKAVSITKKYNYSSAYTEPAYTAPAVSAFKKAFNNTHAIKENDYKNATILQVDFSRPELCAKTKPVSCSIRGKSVVPTNQSWAQLLVAIAELFIKENNPYIHSLEENSLSQMGGCKAFFLQEKFKYRRCELLSNNKWICTNYDSPTIVTIIKNLCKHCHIDLADVIIMYEANNKSVSITKKYNYSSAYTEPAYTAQGVSAFNENVLDISGENKKKALYIIEARFKNGFRKQSKIDFERFNNYYFKEYGINCQLDDNQLNKLLDSEALIYDDRAYIYSEDTVLTIRHFMEQIQSPRISIDVFFNKYSDKFSELSIFSPDMLKAFIENKYRDIRVKHNYIYYRIQHND